MRACPTSDLADTNVMTLTLQRLLPISAGRRKQDPSLARRLSCHVEQC